VAFEHHWLKSFGAREVELVYFFDYAIIVEIIIAGRTNSCARGLSAGPTLLVASRAKAIVIHIINGERIDPSAEATCNLFQFSTHFPIRACLQGEATWIVTLLAPRSNSKMERGKLDGTFVRNHPIKSGLAVLRKWSSSWLVGGVFLFQNCLMNSLKKQEMNGVGLIGGGY
jgi:hypothetical protein